MNYWEFLTGYWFVPTAAIVLLAAFFFHKEIRWLIRQGRKKPGVFRIIRAGALVIWALWLLVLGLLETIPQIARGAGRLIGYLTKKVREKVKKWVGWSAEKGEQE